MESSEAVMIEGENYEVVDECMEEEDSSNFVQVLPPENVNNAPEVVIVDPEEPKPETGEKDEGMSQVADLAATNNPEQSEEQKDVTDEDVISHLEEIENIVLGNMNDFLDNKDMVQDSLDSSVQEIEIKQEDNIAASSTEGSVVSMQCTEPVKLEPDAKLNVQWYERKLKEKEVIVKERLKKLAKVLAFSYPCYEQWLDYVEQKYGSSMCYLQSIQRCRLDKPYTNRWKFICIKKTVQVSSQKADDGDTSDNKNVEKVWQLDATTAWGVNTSNESDFPPFVLRAVKVFNDFLETTGDESVGSEIETSKENFADDVSMDTDPKKDSNNEGRQQWLWLLVRCNSMDELMLFATGRNIDRTTMDRLKQVYESGAGKDCNVKSLYCKSANKCDDTTVTNTTFLVGSEALDEVVGGIKIQLAPKTNFWSNAAGAENVANTVIQLLSPTRGITVLDIGCGIGLIGLMMADKCMQVIGVDSPSEVEEAEMMCELNNIKNAKFLMGSPVDLPAKIVGAVKNRGTYVVINANTNIGRATEVMICLRKMTTVQRIAMITTLTKHSVRAILELVRPDRNNGGPFRPIMAATVDTLPIGPHFEVVILLERGNPNRLMLSPKLVKNLGSKLNNVSTVSTPNKIVKRDSNPAGKPKGNEPQINKKGPSPKKGRPATLKKIIAIKRNENIAKSRQRGKRTHSPTKSDGPPKKLKKFDKFGNKAWRADLGVKKKKGRNETPQLIVNPLYGKKLRDSKEQGDLRDRLSTNRVDTDIAHKVKEHQALLEMAKEKLSGSTPTVDVSTAKQLQSMLNMVLEQTNKLQSQLPRSVWDRIAPAENMNEAAASGVEQKDMILKSRFVQETSGQDIVITTQNQNFVGEETEKKPYVKRNILPLEPDMMPVGPAVPTRNQESYRRSSPDRYDDTNFQNKQYQGALWTRERPFDRNQWNNEGFTRRPVSPARREFSPLRNRNSPPRRFSPPRRQCSPPRKYFSSTHRPVSPVFRQRESPVRRVFSPPPQGPRPISPQQRPPSPFRLRPASPPRRFNASPTRPISPLLRPVPDGFRRQMSPGRRQLSPFRTTTISPPRGQSSPITGQFIPQRRQGPSPTRGMPMSRPIREMVPPNRQQHTIPPRRQHMSPPRRAPSPQRLLLPPARPFSPNRRQAPSPTRFGDEWDIPTRGAVEQNAWFRPAERPADSTWRLQRPNVPNVVTKDNWPSAQGGDRFIKNPNQDKWGGGPPSGWNSNVMQGPSKASAPPKLMQSNPEYRWQSKGDGSDWNARRNDNRGEDQWRDNNQRVQNRWELNNPKESWSQAEKEDWNDLPEDARDPWGDDGNLGLKDRWQKSDNRGNSFPRGREVEQQGDAWSKPKDTWQNKPQLFSSKPQWENPNNPNAREARWFSQNDAGKKGPTGGNTWQSGNNTNTWKPQQQSFQPRFTFTTTQFK